MKKIITIGEILVEIMATEPGDGFREPIALVGPFPSGAPAIFIDQVAKLGQPCGMIACVGADDFGRVNLDRLARDGVDTSAIVTHPELPTGSAFVRYRADGARDFVFNIRHSAAGATGATPGAERLIDGADHLHVMGSSLSTPAIVELALSAASTLRARGGTVSLDPNLRPSVLATPGTRETMERVLALTDLFLPSGPELFLFTEAATEEAATAELLARGIRAVVVKNGADGASYHAPDTRLSAPAFAVEEIDPTGAGDTFAGTFVTLWLRDMAPAEALRLANASGALAVGRKGPMEGTSTRAEIDAFLEARPMIPLSPGHGITSVCSAHPTVIEAALRLGAEDGSHVLIEATCNQVNQDGGYTGMTPAAFRAFVDAIADRVSFPRARLILGGDHLGPNPWKHLPAAEAMAKARTMIDAYARAGFQKLHLDTSMGCAGEPAALPDATTADRAADLAAVAEAAAPTPPAYVIGTEVPIPGGATHALDHLEVTASQAALESVAVHRAAFAARGLDGAFARAIAAVVQPGVEFGNNSVVVYDPAKARALSAALAEMPGFVFEAHSTDYQPQSALAALVRDGFAVLKVGPWLTFALREALYGLDHIAAALDGRPPALADAMEAVMTANPAHWQKYLHGTPADLRRERHFGYSDRIRYYWPEPTAQAAAARVAARLEGRRIPETLVSQYLGALYPDVAAGRIAADAASLQIAAVQRILKVYRDATAPQN